jgi:hypothetical protein
MTMETIAYWENLKAMAESHILALKQDAFDHMDCSFCGRTFPRIDIYKYNDRAVICRGCWIESRGFDVG